jgi:trans-aconitate 2-methyltransferase
VNSPSWDPAQYQRFTDERARPFLDLLGRVHTPNPATEVDLG